MHSDASVPACLHDVGAHIRQRENEAYSISLSVYGHALTDPEIAANLVANIDPCIEKAFLCAAGVWPKLINKFGKLIAEEVLTAALERTFRGFKPDRITKLPDKPKKLSAFFKVVCRSVSADYDRQGKRRPTQHDETLSNLPAGGASPFDSAASNDDERALRTLLNKILNKEEMVLVGLRLDGYSYGKLATMFGVPAQKLRSRVFEAHKKLRKNAILRAWLR
jgi:DNA-directed RNA polymerase specialized sigma24 family protein